MEVLIYTMLICSIVGLLWVFINQILSPIYEIKDAFLRRKIRKSGVKVDEKFAVSVVISAWNESVGIKDTLGSIFNSNYSNLEVIVVDDGSVDDTAKKVIEYYQNVFLLKHADNGKALGLIQHQKNAGKGEGLNTGIKAASGDIIITSDGDSMFRRDTIKNLVKYFIDPNIHAVEGNIKVSNHRSILGLLQKMEYQMGCHFKRAFSVLGCEYVMPGPVSAFRREVFDDIGLLHKVCKTEDLEFTFRLRKAGYNVHYAEDAVVWTEGASTLKDLINQRIRWKKGRLDAMIYHRDMIFNFRGKTNKILSFFIFPMILIFDVVSILMPILLLGSFVLLAINQDIYLVVGWFLLNAISTTIPILFGYKNSFWKIILLSPVFFIFYYVISFVESYALIKSLMMLANRKDVVWQDWKRKGVLNV